MTLGIVRPVMSPASMPTLRSLDPRNAGEDPARIRATIARAPLFAALPITAIEDLTARVTVRKVPDPSFCPSCHLRHPGECW